jgi:hypothetical protein
MRIVDAAAAQIETASLCTSYCTAYLYSHHAAGQEAGCGMAIAA